MKIPITKYITVNNPKEAHKLATEYGLQPATLEEVYLSLNAILKKFPEEAYKEFAMIHPDRQMILDSIEQPKEKKENFSGADGSLKCGEKTSGTDGKTTDTGFTLDLKKQLPFVLITAVAFTGLVILAKNL